MKKFLSFFLVLTIIFSLCSCSKNGNSQQNSSTVSGIKQDNFEMSLLYCESDTINPYTAVTNINIQLCQLIFDPLFKIDNKFNAVNCLAQDIEIIDKTCSVIIKNASFSDMTNVTADDVVYSFNLAKNSNTVFKDQLKGVTSCVAKDIKTVVFTLKKSDPYFANLLDFPIIKKDSDKQTTSDGALIPPIGCGRFTINETEATLNPNERYHGAKSDVEKIKLINAPDSESVSHYVEVGATDIYYTSLNDGKIFQMSSKKVSVPLNNLVYIGVNQNYAPLSNVYLRYAISAAIDRTRISTVAYHTNAIAATGIFHPNFSDTAKYQTIEKTANTKISIENLEKIGYNSVDAGKKISLTVLVNKENSFRVNAAELICEQLKSVGIGATVIKTDFANYKSRLASGNFQLYVGEVRILNNMDVTELIVPGGSSAFGVKETSQPQDTGNPQETVNDFWKISDIVKGFYSGKNTVADIVTAAQTQMPIIPVCFRNGLLFHNKEFKGEISASVSDVFFAIEKYSKN